MMCSGFVVYVVCVCFLASFVFESVCRVLDLVFVRGSHAVTC